MKLINAFRKEYEKENLDISEENGTITISGEYGNYPISYTARIDGKRLNVENITVVTDAIEELGEIYAGIILANEKVRKKVGLKGIDIEVVDSEIMGVLKGLKYDFNKGLLGVNK